MGDPKEMEQPTQPPSLWAATAEPEERHTRLKGEITADAVVVGAGFTGLSTAVHLGEAGVNAVVLDAGDPGWGASGRTGGQAIPGLKLDPDELERRFGPDTGPRLVDAVGRSVDCVFDLIERYRIPCDAVRKGWIQTAHSAAALKVSAERCRQWQERGAPVEMLDRQRVAALVGSDAYVGGWLDRRGGGIQPLSFVRGLARVVERLGGKVFADSRVRSLRRDGTRWRLETAAGAVRAESVVLATNAYTDRLWPKLAKTVVPVYSYQLATRPLGDNVRRTLFPQGHVASDTRRLLNYFRIDRYGRLLMGGRGPFKDRPVAADAGDLFKAVKRIFPQLEAVDPEFVWGGRVAMTADHVPHLHELAPGVYAGLGYNGRGVAMATLMGRYLATLVRGGDRRDIPLPLTLARPLPFHALNRPVVQLVIAYNRMRDAIGG